MHKSFYGLRVLAVTCAVTLMSASTVQAGGINPNEARLVSAASGSFTYEGKTYRATQQYVNELRSYLSAENVDLSAAEVDSLISDMYANIGTGVREGYLTEVKGESDRAESDKASDDPDAASDETADDPDRESDTETDGESAESESEKKSQEYSVEVGQDGVSLVDAGGEIIFTSAAVIKNTGYHTQRVRGICILGMLALAAVSGGIYMVIRHEKV